MYSVLKDGTGPVNIVTVYLSRNAKKRCVILNVTATKGLHLSLCKIYQDFNKQSAILCRQPPLFSLPRNAIKRVLITPILIVTPT